MFRTAVVRTLGGRAGPSISNVPAPAASAIARGIVRQVSAEGPPSARVLSDAGLRQLSTTAGNKEGGGGPGKSTQEEVRTAQHAWEKSCYFNIDYKVDENETVYDAVRRMSSYNVGCLIVTTDGRVSGIITERDYVCKIALLGKQSRETKIKEICTNGPMMVAAKRSDTIETCVKKMISADVRHLPVIDDDTGEVFGLISVKDLVKEYTKERDELLCKMLGLPPATPAA